MLLEWWAGNFDHVSTSKDAILCRIQIGVCSSDFDCVSNEVLKAEVIGESAEGTMPMLVSGSGSEPSKESSSEMTAAKIINLGICRCILSNFNLCHAVCLWDVSFSLGIDVLWKILDSDLVLSPSGETIPVTVKE